MESEWRRGWREGSWSGGELKNKHLPSKYLFTLTFFSVDTAPSVTAGMQT